MQTTTGGAYTISVQPLMNTVYTTKLRNASSTASTAATAKQPVSTGTGWNLSDSQPPTGRAAEPTTRTCVQPAGGAAAGSRAGGG